MKKQHLLSEIAWLYGMGMNKSELCQRLRACSYRMDRMLRHLMYKDPALEGRHLRSRRAKGRLVRARLINDDPHWDGITTDLLPPRWQTGGATARKERA